MSKFDPVAAKAASLEQLAAKARELDEARALHALAVLEAHRHGASMREIQMSSGVSLRRVNSILRHRGEREETGASDAAVDAIENVVIVAGSPAGSYGRSRRLGAFDCQPYRSIRPTARYLGFSTSDGLQPELFAIEHIALSVLLTPDALDELASGDGEFDQRLAALGRTYLEERLWTDGTSRQIVLHSALDDPRTIKLERPIQNVGVSPWTRNQRYVSLQALLSGVGNTNDLEEVEMSVIAAGPQTSVIDPSIRGVAFKINQTYYEGMPAEELYERASYAWATNPDLHEPVDYAFAVAHGVCVAAYRIHSWEEVEDSGGRVRFHGELDEEMNERYRGVDISTDVGRASNPVRYLNC